MLQCELSAEKDRLYLKIYKLKSVVEEAGADKSTDQAAWNKVVNVADDWYNDSIKAHR